MSEEAKPEEPKVVSLFHRKPYVAPKVVSAASSERDDDAISLLKEALARFEAGELRGLVIIAGVGSSDEALTYTVPVISMEAIDNDQLFMGGCANAQNELWHIANEVLDDDEA